MWVENILGNIGLDIILKVIFSQKEEVEAIEDEVKDTIFSGHSDYDSE